MGGSNEFVECLGRGGVGEGALGAVAWLVGDGVEVGLVAGDGGSCGQALDAACECGVVRKLLTVCLCGCCPVRLV